MIFIGGLAVDDELKFALEHVAGFCARMRMAACGSARGNFRNRGDGIVAGREVELLQRRALDAGLLGDGDTDAANATTASPNSIFLIMCFLPVEKV